MMQDRDRDWRSEVLITKQADDDWYMGVVIKAAILLWQSNIETRLLSQTPILGKGFRSSL